MLSLSSKALSAHFEAQRYSGGINEVVLRASGRLSACDDVDVEPLVRESIRELCWAEQASEAGWYLVSECGALSYSLSPLLHDQRPFPSEGLQHLPWCLAQIKSGKAVVIPNVDGLDSSSVLDQAYLKALGLKSLLLISSGSQKYGRTLLLLASSKPRPEWAGRTVNNCTLLEHIYSTAYRRRTAQNSSHEQSNFNRRIFSSSLTPMAVIDDQGHFVTTNAAFLTLVGYTSDELETLRWDEIVLPRKAENKRLADGALSPSPVEVQRYERALVRKDGSLISVVVTVDQTGCELRENPSTLIFIEDLTASLQRDAELDQRQTEIGLLASMVIQSQENERKRLSRELHDDIGQRLSLVTSEVAFLSSQEGLASWDKADRLMHVRGELDALCSDVHEMSHDLHSYKLQHLGLRSALRDLCRRMSTENCRAALNPDDLNDPRSADVALTLYRIAQEALNNALKHAHSAVIHVTLTRVQESFYMTIQDSGVGFDSEARSQGLGIVSMKERARLAGGEIRIHSTPGRGTEIWVAIPDRRASNSSEHEITLSSVSDKSSGLMVA